MGDTVAIIVTRRLISRTKCSFSYRVIGIYSVNGWFSALVFYVFQTLHVRVTFLTTENYDRIQKYSTRFDNYQLLLREMSPRSGKKVRIRASQETDP